jgi:hypothetical protein
MNKGSSLPMFICSGIPLIRTAYIIPHRKVPEYLSVIRIELSGEFCDEFHPPKGGCISID